MLTTLLYAAGLVVITVVIHAAGISALLRAILRSHTMDPSGFVPVTRMVIAITCWLLLIHMLAIALWGLFYAWQGWLPDVESALYFSGVTYTSTGYGDLLLPKSVRLIAPLEALSGVLMGGLSTGMFFAIVFRWVSKWVRRHSALDPDAATPLNGS
jgi:hypothetical protein